MVSKSLTSCFDKSVYRNTYHLSDWRESHNSDDHDTTWICVWTEAREPILAVWIPLSMAWRWRQRIVGRKKSDSGQITAQFRDKSCHSDRLTHQRLPVQPFRCPQTHKRLHLSSLTLLMTFRQVDQDIPGGRYAETHVYKHHRNMATQSSKLLNVFIGETALELSIHQEII